MKKLYYALLFCSGIALAQPAISTPSPLTACDAGNDGVETVDLTIKTPVILNGLSASTHTVAYFPTLIDAQNSVNAFIPASSTSVSNGQTIYVGVYENSQPTLVSTTSFNVIFNASPTATISASGAACTGEDGYITIQGVGGQAPYTFTYLFNGVAGQVTSDADGTATIAYPTNVPGVWEIVLTGVSDSNCSTAMTEALTVTIAPATQATLAPDLTISETPTDGIATFDLTSNTPIVLGTQDPENFTVSYHYTPSDAEAGTNAFAMPSAYENTSNPQTVYVRVQSNLGGCFAVSQFDLHVVNSGIVNIPDANFKAALVTASPTNQVVSTVNPNSSNTPDVYTAIDTNGDGEIQYSEAEAIVFMNVNNKNIASLVGIEAFTNLKQVYAAYNDLTTVDFGDNTALEFTALWDNNLTSVDLTGLPNLKTFSASNNNLTAVNFTQNDLLENVVVTNNQLTSLNLDNADNLMSIAANTNSITTFSIADKSQLTNISFLFNGMTDITLTNLPHLYKVKVNNNNLTSLDLSTVAYEPFLNNIPNASVYEIAANNNLGLSEVILKNGFFNPQIELVTSNLANNVQYICIDEDETFDYEWFNDEYYVSTYCNFTPGGLFNTISGTVKFDADNDGCETTDITPNFVKVTINDGTEEGYAFVSNDSAYGFFTQAGNFTVAAEVENPTYFNVSPAANVSFPDNNSNTATEDFCLSANGVHHDVEVAIIPVTPSRPGFDAVYKIILKNKGNQLNNGTVIFTYDEAHLDWISSAPVQDSQSAGSLTFNYSGLQPFESRVISEVTFSVNEPGDMPPVNIDDVLTFTVDASALNGTDDLPLDNVFTYNETVVGAFDPNDKKCLEGEVVSPTLIGDYLHYVINFENTGNYPAENVVIKDVIDATKFDVSSLQIISSSHHVVGKSVGDGTIFIFQTINLESGGHGNILLKVRTLDTLNEGDVVTNTADIFFDYNLPITTDTASTTFQSLKVDNPNVDASVRLFPNPAGESFTVTASTEIKSIALYDIQGRVLQVKTANDMEVTFDISGKQSGIYFVKVASENGVKIEKLIKK